MYELHGYRDRSIPSDRISRGFMVDVTDDQAESIGATLNGSRQDAAALQQATGVVMAAFAMSEEAAFAVISSVSRFYSVSMHDLAQRTMVGATSGAAHSPRDVSEQLVAHARRLAFEQERRDSTQSPADRETDTRS